MTHTLTTLRQALLYTVAVVDTADANDRVATLELGQGIGGRGSGH